MQVIEHQPLTGDEREAVERRFRPVGGCTQAFELGAFVVILPMFLALIATVLFQRWMGDNPGCAAGAVLFLILASIVYAIVRRKTATLSLRDFDSTAVYRLEVAKAGVVNEDEELYLLETADGMRVLLHAWMCEDIFPQRIVTMKTIPPLNLIVSLRAEGGELEVEETSVEEVMSGDYKILD